MVEQTIADQLEEDVLEQIDGDNAENPITRIKKRIDENDTSRGFSISRIPTEAHEDFKTMAETMFADDYGMTLAFLVHYFKITDGNNQAIQQVADDLNSKLERIEAKLDEEDVESGKEVDTVQ